MNQLGLRDSIQRCTNTLLEMVKDHCWNRIPDEVVYIISEIKDWEGSGWEKRYQRRREKDKFELMNFDTMMSKLEDIYSGIHDINLYVHRVDSRQTIVDVRYYPKEKVGYDTKPATPSMLHAKIALPPYRGDGKQKFDVHWEFGGLRHRWKMFLWRQEFRRNRLRRKT